MAIVWGRSIALTRFAIDVRHTQTSKIIQHCALVTENDHFCVQTCYLCRPLHDIVHVLLLQYGSKDYCSGHQEDKPIIRCSGEKWSFSATRAPFLIILGVYRVVINLAQVIHDRAVEALWAWMLTFCTVSSRIPGGFYRPWTRCKLEIEGFPTRPRTLESAINRYS